MDEKICTFQLLKGESSELHTKDDKYIKCSLTQEYSRDTCRCVPEICPIYQIWKMMSK